MPGVCDRILAPAPPGNYELETSSADSTNDVTLTGSHSVNGVVVATWTQSSLFNQTIPIAVHAGESHQTILQATFKNDATVTVSMKRNGSDAVPPCTLTRSGNDQSAIALIAAGSDSSTTGGQE